MAARSKARKRALDVIYAAEVRATARSSSSWRRSGPSSRSTTTPWSSCTAWPRTATSSTRSSPTTCRGGRSRGCRPSTATCCAWRPSRSSTSTTSRRGRRVRGAAAGARPEHRRVPGVRQRGAGRHRPRPRLARPLTCARPAGRRCGRAGRGDGHGVLLGGARRVRSPDPTPSTRPGTGTAGPSSSRGAGSRVRPHDPHGRGEPPTRAPVRQSLNLDPYAGTGGLALRCCATTCGPVPSSTPRAAPSSTRRRARGRAGGGRHLGGGPARGAHGPPDGGQPHRGAVRPGALPRRPGRPQPLDGRVCGGLTNDGTSVTVLRVHATTTGPVASTRSRAPRSSTPRCACCASSAPEPDVRPTAPRRPVGVRRAARVGQDGSGDSGRPDHVDQADQTPPFEPRRVVGGAVTRPA